MEVVGWIWMGLFCFKVVMIMYNDYDIFESLGLVVVDNDVFYIVLVFCYDSELVVCSLVWLMVDV